MPLWKNLWVNPEALFGPERPVSPEEREVEMQVTGLLCRSLCVARVQQALQEYPGVVAVTPLSGPGHFLVRYRSALALEGLRRAVLRQVVLPWVRRWLGAAGRLLRNG